RVRPEIGVGAEALVLRALAKDPAARFASAAEMGAAIETARILAAGETTVAMPTRPIASEPAAAGYFASVPRRRGLAGWPWLAVPLGVALLLLALVGRGVAARGAGATLTPPPTATIAASPTVP